MSEYNILKPKKLESVIADTLRDIDTMKLDKLK